MRKLAALLCVFVLAIACDDVTFVERIILVNPTDYDILVEVKGPGDASWLPLGIANRKSDTVKEGVIDQGSTWVFRFSYVREELGEGQITRSRLIQDRWRYEIPDRVGQILKDKGYEPSVG